MPNWCANRLSVAGTRNAVHRFKDWLDTLKGEDGFFNAILPMPKELAGLSYPAHIISDAEYEEALKHSDPLIGAPITQAMSFLYRRKFGADNWYDWRNSHWDTKWDCAIMDIERRPYKNGCGISLYFATAWGPPSRVIEVLADQFPTLKFSLAFHEPGNRLKGVNVYGPYN